MAKEESNVIRKEKKKEMIRQRKQKQQLKPWEAKGERKESEETDKTEHQQQRKQGREQNGNEHNNSRKVDADPTVVQITEEKKQKYQMHIVQKWPNNNDRQGITTHNLPMNRCEHGM